MLAEELRNLVGQLNARRAELLRDPLRLYAAHEVAQLLQTYRELLAGLREDAERLEDHLVPPHLRVSRSTYPRLAFSREENV